MITDNDKLIISHVEKYGFITLKQATMMYYNRQARGYDICRKRMAKLVAGDYLKEIRNYDTNEKIFYDPKRPIKKVSLHGMLLMNYYAQLYKSGANVMHFQKEVEWLNGDIRSDGFCMFEFEREIRFQIIEVHVSHNSPRLDRYEKLYKSGEAHKICYGRFPDIVFIDNVEHLKPIEIPMKDVKLFSLDFEFNSFSKIFL